jgi:hypothetical protein
MNRLRAAFAYARSALWFVPLIAIPIELVLTRLLHELDQRLGWTLLGLGATGARAVLESTVTMTMSFLVFTFGSLLVAIQDRRRPAHTQDHRNNPSAGQRRALRRRPVRLFGDVGDQRARSAGDASLSACATIVGGPRRDVQRQLVACWPERKCHDAHFSDAIGVKADSPRASQNRGE